MNILVVNTIAKISHSLRPEVQIYLHWAAAGHDVTIFSPASEYKATLEQAGITVYESQQKHKISWRTIKTLRAMLASKRYDIIYATNSKTIPSAAFAAIGFDSKLVCYRGTISGLYRTDPTAYLTVLHPRVDGVVCVSDAVTQYVKHQVWKNKANVVTIFKGHDLSWYQHAPGDLTQFGVPKNAFVAIAVARFRPSKGLLVLLEAANHIAHLKDFHLLIVGSGADSEPYTSALANNKMGQRIHLTGHRDDAVALIAASDVLVQASTKGEGLPRSIIEGLACGKPAISTTTGGAKEILEEGKSGYIVPVCSAVAIADKLAYLYENRQLLPAMSEYCKSTIQTTLSSDATAKKHIAFFESLIAR